MNVPEIREALDEMVKQGTVKDIGLDPEGGHGYYIGEFKTDDIRIVVGKYDHRVIVTNKGEEIGGTDMAATLLVLLDWTRDEREALEE